MFFFNKTVSIFKTTTTTTITSNNTQSITSSYHLNIVKHILHNIQNRLLVKFAEPLKMVLLQLFHLTV